MKGSLIPAHRRPTFSGGEKVERGASAERGSLLSVLMPQEGKLTGTPWDSGVQRKRPSSAGIRRTIVSNGFSLFGENKAAAEIRSGLGRPASASLGGRNLSSAGSLILENKAAAATKAEDFVPLKKLGQGASGLVHLAQLKEDGSHWVLKQVELGRASSAPSSERSSLIARAERDNVLREVKLMSSIKNENLIKFCTSFLHQTTGGPQSVFIVMEYAQRGALSDYIKQIRSTASHADELFVWRCMLQVGCGLAAIHAHRVIHRDIKSANILITANEHFKIADLGIAVSTSLCNVQGRMRTGRCGTMGYTAPEVSNDMPYDARADMWSLGCVLYEVACHRVPFPSGTVVDTDVRCEAGISMQDITDAANALQLPHTYSDLLNNHVLWCLVVDASGRPSARQLISTQDTIRKAVELKITLPDGFEFPLTNQDEDRVEYGGELPVDKRRGGRASSARAPLSGIQPRQAAWGESQDSDSPLSPIQPPPNPKNEGKVRSSRPLSASSRSQSARPPPVLKALASRPSSAREAGGGVTLSRGAQSDAIPRRGSSDRGGRMSRSEGGGGAHEMDSHQRSVTSHISGPWKVASSGAPLSIHAAEDDEKDLPENLRSTEQAAWERKHKNMLQALPGWHAESGGGGVGGEGEGEGVERAREREIVLRSVGAKKTAKKLTKQEKLEAAGAQRRLISAIRNVLSLAHNSASRVAAQPLHKLEGLLVAQMGIPLAKMLQNAGKNGAACRSLGDFLGLHPKQFRVGDRDEVFLADEKAFDHSSSVGLAPAASASARILSTILNKNK